MNIESILLLLVLAVLLYLVIDKINEKRTENIIEEDPTDAILKMLGDKDSPLTAALEKVNNSLVSNESGLSSVLSWQISLNNIFASDRKRGALAETQVEKVLEIMEFKKGVHYEKAKVIEGNRPDFTFNLPEEKIVNLDCKFPTAGWKEYNVSVDELSKITDESEREKKKDELDGHKKNFIKKVKGHIDDIVKREGYISPENGTVDYLFMYIPLDSMYQFILEEKIGDMTATEYALKKGVIIVTPGVLFAYLSTINHAMKVFYIEENVKELVEAFKAFKTEWETYTEYYEEVQKSLDTTQERFDLLVDRRTKALNRKIDSMDDLSVDGASGNLEE